MKKRLFLLMVLLCCLTLVAGVFAACNGDGTGGPDDDDAEPNYHTVTFDTQGGTEMDSVTVQEGEVIGKIDAPTKQCAEFMGFSTDPVSITMWDAENDTVLWDMTLYAVWEDAHTWGEWEETLAPTCTTEGTDTRTCSVCGAEDTRQTDMLAHDIDGVEWSFDDHEHWKICRSCLGEAEKTPHDFDETGICECGAIDCSGFSFDSIGDNEWEVSDYYGDRTDVIIPSVHSGGAVTGIGDWAFSNCSNLTSISIPDSVTSIGLGAFQSCNGLTSVTIPDSVTSIGNNAFGDCNKLVEVYNKSDLDTVAGSIDHGYVGYYAEHIYTEEGGSWLTDTEDDYRFFYDGEQGYLMGYYGSETELAFPSSFTAYDGTLVENYAIYDYAFCNCTELTSITIPNDVTSIGDYAFSGCTGLTSIAIPDSVTSIGDYAFSWCDGLTSVTIGNSVTSIGDYAFA